MKKRNGEFRCVYAGPEFFARQNGESSDEPVNIEPTEPEAQETERESYPESFKANENEDDRLEAKKRRARLRILYAGPEMLDRNNMHKGEPLMQAVYACPPLPSVSDECEQFVSCPNCGSVCGAATNFCANCGEKLLEMRKCSRCGTLLDEGANFCRNCGAPASDKGEEMPKKPFLRKGFFARPKGSRDELV